MKRLLIIDQMNMFIRNWIVNPTLSMHGQPVGGLVGSLKSLQKVARETKPDRIIIVWDGEGGSKRRKRMQADYKHGRTPLRKNYEVPGMTEEGEAENRNWQVVRLMEYFNKTPVIQMIYDGVEADDIIAYLARTPHFVGWNKIIVSSDEDFVQLLDQETLLYRPVQDEVLNVKRAIEKFGIHPNNFALAKAVVGDKGDNVVGVKGAGFKTLAKRYPFLAEETTHYHKRLIKDSKELLQYKVAKEILANEQKILDNYKIVQLYSPLISAQIGQNIMSTLNEFVPSMNRTELRMMLTKDGISETTLSEVFKFFEVMINKEK